MAIGKERKPKVINGRKLNVISHNLYLPPEETELFEKLAAYYRMTKSGPFKRLVVEECRRLGWLE